MVKKSSKRSCNTKVCVIDGCERVMKYGSKGWCNMHYKRWFNYGDPLKYKFTRGLAGCTNVRYREGYKYIYKEGKEKGEHVWVMQEHLKRKLLKGEFVHHKNGHRLDNRIENLELWTRAHPSGQRVGDLLAWAKELLETYKDKPLPEHLLVTPDVTDYTKEVYL